MTHFQAHEMGVWLRRIFFAVLAIVVVDALTGAAFLYLSFHR